MLADTTLRATIEAFAGASLNVAVAARSLFIHPSTLRYRLRRIAARTGRDPFVAADLIELTTAARVLGARPSVRGRKGTGDARRPNHSVGGGGFEPPTTGL